MELYIEKLIEIVGKENVKSDPADLIVYGSDSSVHEAAASAVVRPENVEHVQENTNNSQRFGFRNVRTSGSD